MTRSVGLKGQGEPGVSETRGGARGVIKRRSRVLRRRTRQAALDKQPRVHDGQLGFAILEQKASVTAENRTFEEKQPLVFLPKAANSWVHGGVGPQEREYGAGGGGGEREVKRKFCAIPWIGRADKKN